MGVNTETQKNCGNLEVVKWVIVAILLITAITGNYFYRDLTLLLRAAAVIILITSAAGVALYTMQGKTIIAFMREAKIEAYKIIRPSHQETLHITLIVTIVTIIISLVLWGLDGLIVRLVSFITSLRL